MQAFVRQLGKEPGVQLNPLVDGSEMPSTDNSDQVFGIVMRATRGRIDKPFTVYRSNVYKKLGEGEQIRVNALNEAWVHVVEALNNGAYAAVVKRITTEDAKIKYAVCRKSDSEEEGQDPYTFSVEDELPSDEFLFAVKHLECFNDGIVLSFHADETQNDEGEDVGNPYFTIRLSDKDGTQLYEYEGSLDPDAKDDYGVSAYLPDVVASQTDAIELTIGVTGEKAVIDAGKDGYGYTSNGQQSWVESDVLVCFEEGGFSYTTQDYMKAREALQYAPEDFAYISSGGTQSPALLAQLAQLAFDTNKQLRFDVPGKLDAEAAIAFVKQLNMGANKCSHLMHAFWSPIKSDDPTGVNPKGYFGVATLNIAYACGRNASVDSKGFAKKNYPIAGREWPIGRTGMVQTAQLDSPTLSQLAEAKINPCIYEVYTGGGRFVFSDSITCAQVEVSLKKLIAVADMSTSIDDAVTRAAKDCLQLPMDKAIDKMDKYLTTLFEGAEAAKWITAASDPMMEGKSAKWTVQASEAKPYELMVIDYWVRYVGTNRQTHVTQTLSR